MLNVILSAGAADRRGLGGVCLSILFNSRVKFVGRSDLHRRLHNAAAEKSLTQNASKFV